MKFGRNLYLRTSSSFDEQSAYEHPPDKGQAGCIANTFGFAELEGNGGGFLWQRHNHGPALIRVNG